MPELITIPSAAFEMVVEYSRPNMKLLVDRAKVVDQLFEKFSAWHIKVDDVDVKNDGKPSEQGVKFNLAAKRTSFMFGAGSCKLVWDDADWGLINQTIDILDAGWKTLEEIGEVKAGAFKTTIILHIQPKTMSYIDVLRPIAPPSLVALESSSMKAAAAVVKWDRRRITVDGSAQLANGVFIKLEREFESTSSYQDIAKQLLADELQIFELLGVGVQEDHL